MNPFMRSFGTLALLLAIRGMAAGAPSAIIGTEFLHGNWEAACDNTGTCRAAGYAPVEDDDRPASLLLIRKAGAATPVIGKLGLMPATRDSDMRGAEVQEIMRNGDRIELNLIINDKQHGSIPVTASEPTQLDATLLTSELLDERQVAAILGALLTGDKIRLKSSQAIERQISTAGGLAALSFMDAFQRRTGTPGALVRKGDRSSTDLLQPAHVPAIRKVTPPPADLEEEHALQARLQGPLLAALREFTQSRIDEGAYDCSFLLDDSGDGGSRLTLTRLNEDKLLASTLVHGDVDRNLDPDAWERAD